MDCISVLDEVKQVFSFVDMPPQDEMVPSTPRTIESEEIREDMEAYRGKEITGEAIRTIQRYFPVLSAKATRWILPHFLRYCLTPDAESDRRRQVESLIYALSPEVEYVADAAERFTLLNAAQIACLVHFLEQCLKDPYWVDAYPERILEGILFLRRLLAHRYNPGQA